MLSPDALILQLERWQALTPHQRRKFAPLCTDLVVELASPSDEGPRGLTALRRKMAAEQSNGAQLDAGPLFPRLRIALEEIWTV